MYRTLTYPILFRCLSYCRICGNHIICDFNRTLFDIIFQKRNPRRHYFYNVCNGLIRYERNTIHLYYSNTKSFCSADLKSGSQITNHVPICSHFNSNIPFINNSNNEQNIFSQIFSLIFQFLLVFLVFSLYNKSICAIKEIGKGEIYEKNK